MVAANRMFIVGVLLNCVFMITIRCFPLGDSYPADPMHMESKKVNCDGPGFQYKGTKISDDKLVVSFNCGAMEKSTVLACKDPNYRASSKRDSIENCDPMDGHFQTSDVTATDQMALVWLCIKKTGKPCTSKKKVN
ncbi:uncharacterized protein [Clytia hemisphaerica]